MQPSTHQTNKRALVGLDLFAGAGGFSLAARYAGVEIVAAVENDKSACRTYRRNLISDKASSTHLFEADALEISASQLLSAANLGAGEIDLVIGGPPCQGFSAHRLNDAGVGDSRNSLLLRYFDLVSVIRPSVFVVENVPGMLWARHRDYVSTFYRLAEESGYKTFAPVMLNAKDYGAPQNRKRVFLLAIRGDVTLNLQWPPLPTHADPSSDAVKSGALPGWKPARVVFETPFPSSDENDLHMNHGEDLVEVFKRTPKNGGSRWESGRQLPCHTGHSGHSDVYGRIALDVPGPTMTTACINPSKGRFVHPMDDHGITLRQAARFQTFPDDFVFEGGLMAAGKQIGNAVPIILGMAVLAPIANALKERQNHQAYSGSLL